jgi:hypothetical protein
MTLLELKSYFEAYAIKHLELKHDPTDDMKRTFFCVNTEDRANDYIRSAPMDLVMILMPYEKDLASASAENYSWSKNTCFFILQRCDIQNNDEIIAAQSRCEQIADDFCSVMIADRYDKLSSLESGSVNMVPVGPVVDSHYGYMCVFNIVDSFGHYVNPNRWLP